MARNRMIKPQFWEDIKVANLSRDIRLLYIGIWNFCDDMGVIPGSEMFIKSKVFPYDPIGPEEFRTWLDKLEELKLIQVFGHRGQVFYLLPKFLKHQKIDKPNYRDLFVPKELSLSLLESIEDQSTNDLELFDDESTINRRTVVDQSTVKKRKEKESKVKEIRRGKISFVPPITKEVEEYFFEKTQWSKDKITHEASRFVNFYESKNWYVGKNKMSKWKSAASGWIERSKEFQHGTTTQRNNSNAGAPFIPTDEFGSL